MGVQEGILPAIRRLETYIAEEGPFEGVIAFSHGAALVSAYSVDITRRNLPHAFRCAIFLLGARPFDTLSVAKGGVEFVLPLGNENLIKLPTAHIGGSKDDEWKAYGDVLHSMCDEMQREVFIHGQWHGVPGGRAHEDLQGCIKAIRRTIDKVAIEGH